MAQGASAKGRKRRGVNGHAARAIPSIRVKGRASAVTELCDVSADPLTKAPKVKRRWDEQEPKEKRWTLSGDGRPERRARAAVDEKWRLRNQTTPPRASPTAERQGEARAERAAPEPPAQPPPRRQAQKRKNQIKRNVISDHL